MRLVVLQFEDDEAEQFLESPRVLAHQSVLKAWSLEGPFNSPIELANWALDKHIEGIRYGETSST